MIDKLFLENFGVHRHISWAHLKNINLIIGENGTGKTYILKAMYTALRSLEQYQKGNDNRNLADILSDNLYWTFQPTSLGKLVKREGNERLHCVVGVDGRDCQ